MADDGAPKSAFELAMERLRKKDAAEIDWSDRWKELSAPFTAKTNSEGKATVRGLLPGRLNVTLLREGYELVPAPNSTEFGVAWDSYAFRETPVEVSLGEMTRATVTMRRQK